ncbi:MAG: ribbon-helix-helix protein, CopG family [Desulfobacteraceae bacterium]|nr:ribbon-helix-helix protein, CopG family [Desulfobacteraceae bacterium]MCP4346564.1 ribbon-helix-helix protein, CopG family [Desulfobacterales bacterium]
MASDVIPKKRINIELPEIIIDRLDSIASQMNFSRSELIRRFISEKIAEKEKESLEQSMREGYLANYDFIKESSSEWDFTLKDGA